MIFRVAKAKRPTKGIFGTRFLCFVFIMRLANSTRSPGMRVNTDTRLMRIDLVRVVPRSAPSPYPMKRRASRPEIVVRELEEISGMEWPRATMTASLVS